MQWAERADVEILAVELPGRAKRHREPFAESLREVAEALVPLLRERISDPNVPYSVVGHSMGCWAGYEFLALVQNLGLPPPTIFCVACFPPPSIPMGERSWQPNKDLEKEAFQAECREWDVNPSVFRAGIWEAFEPLLRADFQLFDTYERLGELAPLRCPVAGFAARDDRRVSEDSMRKWESLSSAFEMAAYVEGHHLFIYDDAAKQRWFDDLVNIITAKAGRPVADSASEGAAGAYGAAS